VVALIVKDGPLAGRRFEIESRAVIGRKLGDIVLEDTEASRRHAEIRAGADGVVIEDLDSTNGTWVNGERIHESRRLAGGDSIRIGQTTFELEAPASDRTAVAAIPEVTGPPPTVSAERIAAVPAPPLAVPAPAPAAVAAPTAPPPSPFDPSVATTPRRRRGSRIASRIPAATLLTLAAIVGTAVALIAYFALRG
jgi:predicted component of type VI protein secretion system